MEVSREKAPRSLSPDTSHGGVCVGGVYLLSSYIRFMKNRKEYPKYKKANLEKHGVLETGDLAYLFVHQMHPAIALLRANKDLLGSDIDSQQKIDNEWYKVCFAVVPSSATLAPKSQSSKVNPQKCICLTRTHRWQHHTPLEMVNGPFSQVQKETFTACCNTLRTKVLSKVSTVDLNNFSVEVSPIGTRYISISLSSHPTLLALSSHMY